MNLKIGRLEVEAGGLYHKRLGIWIPDGLHIWYGWRGVHLYWARSPHMPRISFDRIDPKGEAGA